MVYYYERTKQQNGLSKEVLYLSEKDVTAKFQKIYDDTYDYIFRYVMSKAEKHESGEDIIQNVYLTFY